ncbi:nitroreductase family protein [Christensenellaceae bacterium NSJ-44]|uniref:Nitroreductase family protein n=1 Tax=Luoshenia tenuis TaxID=2763654 RepID=A0A926CZN5_9FIRM|nr:nitroreductase family protein [Luoshenia tenuis]MBC8528661.1 nitroreductase family protein [Luoshenia tenuis]
MQEFHQDNRLSVIFNRRSVRSYQDRPVEREKLELLLKAAMAAPSARNSKPWAFVVVDQPESMNALRDTMLFGKYNAPAAIVVCGDMSKTQEGEKGGFWIEDCSAALENILIAAVGLDLGTVWLGSYPNSAQYPAVQKTLGLPDTLVPLGVVYIGYPAEKPEPRTQYDEAAIHWQRFGGQKN